MDYSKLSDEKVLKAYEAAISNTYRFAQFYGNTFVALFFLVGAKIWVTDILLANWLIAIIVVIALVALFIAHRGQLSGTYSILEQILS